MSEKSGQAHLFDPQRFPFLEGRTEASAGLEALPLVSDGIVHRILEKLCLLGGERVSYRTLDVEEIGSVYQTIMGFGVEVVAGPAVALKGKRKNGGVPASPVINLEDLLALSAKDRPKWLKERADTELTGEADKRLKAAETLDDLLAALEKRIDRNATPAPVPKGGLVLQPTDERRRSGSHYTPRSFTEPIVRKTLEPILKRCGDQPTPAQILEFKIADIAVGSAAFLVETCRQLGDSLVRAWRVHGGRPALPPDETEELLAMRLVAQRCLYGVDRNPMAADLAKLSLWLATLAKDHPFTFLDHSIRCGDSLVGLTREQIACFTWQPPRKDQQLGLIRSLLDTRIEAAMSYRREILESGDLLLPALKSAKLKLADEALAEIRFIGDAAIAAFFAADKDKAREAKRAELAERIADYLGRGQLKQCPYAQVKALRAGQFPVTPFHWEIEYPEVFDRENPGFDGIVGNPPFAGHVSVSAGNRTGYTDYLRFTFEDSGGKCDLVAFFFRKSFRLLRDGATFGLIASKTICQGDTRASGLSVIRGQGGVIYSATRSEMWPGQAAVIVSIVHIAKGKMPLPPLTLDRRVVPIISAYLFPTGPDSNPTKLAVNAGNCFQGSVLRGMGFTFDDSTQNQAASPLRAMEIVLRSDPTSAQIIQPLIGGEEVNSSPQLQHHRYVINFGEREKSEAEKWPQLFEIVSKNVLPERLASDAKTSSGRIVEKFWQFGHTAKELYQTVAKRKLQRVLANSQVTARLGFGFLSSQITYAHTTNVFCFESDAAFAILQSTVHEHWARFLGSSLGGTLRYTPTDCFETFPFPAWFETNAALEVAGREYYEFRAAFMQDLWLGLTEIYNLFHSPDDDTLARLEALWQKRLENGESRVAAKVPEDRKPMTLYPTPPAAMVGVRRMRELHAAMDAAVLTAYGWSDLLPRCTCEFLLDYEDEEDDSTESTGRRKKKPWRYRWPDDVRDEVLARLLKLNAERAEEERRAGLIISSTTKSAAKAPTGAKGGRKPKVSAAEDAAPLSSLKQGDLFS